MPKPIFLGCYLAMLLTMGCGIFDVGMLALQAGTFKLEFRTTLPHSAVAELHSSIIRPHSNRSGNYQPYPISSVGVAGRCLGRKYQSQGVHSSRSRNLIMQ